MKNVLVKKIIIICSVLLTVVVSAVLVAVISGNTKVPAISNPNQVFYQRLDDQGNVIYEITNKDLFEEIKSNDGLEQLLYMVDADLLASYIDNIANDAAAIADKIQELTYNTSDDAVIAEMDADTRADLELTYAQSMILSGYTGNEEEYAVLSLAREAFVRAAVDEDGDVTDLEVAAEFMNNYFEDCKAIKIRFTSAADANYVMKKFNLMTYNSTTLRSYLGFIYNSETLKDSSDHIVQAYIPAYYFDANNNILNLSDAIVYTKGTTVYTDSAAKEYTLDGAGNLIDSTSKIIISKDFILSSKALATAFQTANYYTVSKVNAFDTTEQAVVKNANDEILFYVDYARKIYDANHVEITATTNLIVNKIYKSINDVTTVTVNNSAEMTNDQVLAAYIKMYNYVYGYRTQLAEAATAADLNALDNEFLTQNFEKVNAVSTALSKYLFDTLDLSVTDAIPYSASAKSFAGAKDTNHYMIYKLTQPAKVDAYKIMLDYIEDRIVVPAEVAADFSLPSTGWYGAKITWKSGTTATISIATTATDGTYKATVTKPEANANVVLTYSITMSGETRTGTVTVLVKTSGSNSDVTEPTGDQIAFKTVLANDTLYNTLYNKLIDEIMNDADNLKTTVNEKLAALRAEHDFELYDYYMGVDYKQSAKDFEYTSKGSKTVLASYDDVEITANEFFDYCVEKNGALYSLYSVQLKEMVYSSYFEAQGMFGTQRNLERNNSDKMDTMYDSVASTKSYYAYLQNLYAQYGMDFPYTSFTDYAYVQYGTKTEMDLLKYFVEGAIQPFIINEAIKEYNLIDLFTDTVEEYYNNYFSLNVTHLIINLDFDEDGSPDDYDEYLASLDAAERVIFDARIADFETQITTYLDAATTNTFTTLVTAYQAASREDATWGRFKQYGFVLITEDLNIADEDDEKVKHSLQYSGTYGIKDKFVQEYVDALIALYQEYQDPQNVEETSLRSDLIPTVYGLHLILATQGDDFERFSAAFSEANTSAPVYTDGSQNSSEIPNLAQLKLYATYYFYNSVYNLKVEDVEETYGITVPNIPASVSSALDFYFKGLLESMYVVGTVNIRVVDRIAVGEFKANDAAYKAQLSIIRNVYDTALYGDYRN